MNLLQRIQVLVQSSLVTQRFEAEILQVVEPDASKKINKKLKASTIWMSYLENKTSFICAQFFSQALAKILLKWLGIELWE